MVVHRHPRPAVEHPGDRRPRPDAGAPRALPLAEPSQLRRRRRRGLRACRSCTPPGSPRSCSPCSTRLLLTVRIRVENAALARASARAGPRRRRCPGDGRRRGPRRRRRRTGRPRPPRCTPAAPVSTCRSASRGPATIDKACGEGLMPGAVAALADLGVDPDGQPLRGIRYVAGDRSAEARLPRGAGRGVRRTTLHDALADGGRGGRHPGGPRRPSDEVAQDDARVRRRRHARSLRGRGRRAALADPAAAGSGRGRRSRSAASGCAATPRSRPWTSTSRCTGPPTRRPTSPRWARASSASRC